LSAPLFSTDTRFVAFDLETTGLHKVRDRIVTATVVGHPDADVNLLINPGMPIPWAATNVHGITDEMASKGMPYPEGLAALGDALTTAWASGATVVGHNVLSYDLPMLRLQERQVFGHVRTQFGPVVDTMKVFKARFPTHRYNLAAACKAMGITLDNAHNAYADAVASLELAQSLAAGGANISVPPHGNAEEIPASQTPTWAAPAVFPLTDEESVLSVPGHNGEFIVKTTRREGQLVALTQFDLQGMRWGASAATVAGVGKAAKDSLESVAPHARRVPKNVASYIGVYTGQCLMCGRDLQDPDSLARGYGPECRDKLSG